MNALAARAALEEHKLAEIRFIGDLMGSYVLLNAAKVDDHIQVFACRARSISSREAVVNAPVSGSVGDPLTVNFQGIGLLKGEIARLLDGGFLIRFSASEDQSKMLAARIDWLKQRKLKTVVERRRHKRVLPRETRATLVLGVGSYVSCMLIDMSQSGVAVSAVETPRIGALVAVGSVPGQVVRHFDCGFAVQFIEEQRLEELEALLTLKTDHHRTLAKQAIRKIEA
ncbi:PilZ domain-containing protein [Devosia sp.]|uniref:PilZ domain-containing protein n=1 Tax=Devosia sp. TaxID=1871048 RepID=UPI003BABCF05